MLIKNTKALTTGSILAVLFIGVLILIFSPVFNGVNGLKFADDNFNKLAKGSAYYIPEVSQSVGKYAGQPFSVTIKMDEGDDIERTAGVFTTAGTSVERAENALKIHGDLGAVLKNILADSDLMYKNEGSAVSSRYGFNEKEVMKTWWRSLGKIEKVLKKNKQVEQSNAVGLVISKAVEPAYNFYGIETQRVADYAGMLSGMLIFYVIYTMWWGYAIFFLFEGIGLSMKKAKVKKEV